MVGAAVCIELPLQRVSDSSVRLCALFAPRRRMAVKRGMSVPRAGGGIDSSYLYPEAEQLGEVVNFLEVTHLPKFFEKNFDRTFVTVRHGNTHGRSNSSNSSSLISLVLSCCVESHKL